jgi:hypothetical protein
MNPDDAQIMKAVQGVLVRHYVNTQKIDIDVINKNVYLDGEFLIQGKVNLTKDEGSKDRIESHHEDRKALTAIEREIRVLGNVEGISFRLKNWVKSGTGWIPQ